MRKKIYASIQNNAVTWMFVALCVVSFAFSGYSVNFLLMELMSRLSRNAFIVLSLIIPIVAGMGINFAITIGAMAAQIAILLVLQWRIPGVSGFFMATAVTIPIAALFGYFVGKMLNRIKGQEMIGSMILGYFANGLYQLLFLFIFGNLIAMDAPGLVIRGASGIANTLDLAPAKMTYALDNIIKLPFDQALYIVMGVLLVWAIVSFARKRIQTGQLVIWGVIAVGSCLLMQVQAIREWFTKASVPVVVFLWVGLLCLFNVAILRTRLGQQFRAVGQNIRVANAAGINVDRTRLIAITFSTVLAAVGQLIFVQNMGSFQTYGAHEQVGLYAGAAILVGGASITRATNTQALIGCLLFHMLFIVATPAGNNLFGNAMIGEYFRVFVCYAVITLALVLHGMQEKSAQNQLRRAGR